MNMRIPLFPGQVGRNEISAVPWAIAARTRQPIAPRRRDPAIDPMTPAPFGASRDIDRTVFRGLRRAMRALSSDASLEPEPSARAISTREATRSCPFRVTGLHTGARSSDRDRPARRRTRMRWPTTAAGATRMSRSPRASPRERHLRSTAGSGRRTATNASATLCFSACSIPFDDRSVDREHIANLTVPRDTRSRIDATDRRGRYRRVVSVAVAIS